MATTNSIAISAVAVYFSNKVASLPKVSIADKTKVYLYTNKLNDINYQRDCSSVKLPGQNKGI